MKDNDKNIIVRNNKTKIVLLPTGEVEKLYLKGGGVGRDQRNLTYLMEHFGSVFYNGWEIRTLRILWVALDKKSIGIEYIRGVPIVELNKNELKIAEYLAGVWLSHYQNSIMENKDYGPLYADFNLHNCMVDNDEKLFVVIDPGWSFGKPGYIFMSIYEHIYSIFACSIKNKYNPFVLIKPFLRGYLSGRTEDIRIRTLIKSFIGYKSGIFRAFLKNRPYKIVQFMCGTFLLLPVYLIYVPLFLKYGKRIER